MVPHFVVSIIKGTMRVITADEFANAVAISWMLAFAIFIVLFIARWIYNKLNP